MGFLVKGVKSVVKAVVGVVSKVVGGVFGFAVGGGGKTKATSAISNLNKSLDPEAYRKIVFGRVAAPLDVRFWQVWGSKGEKFDEVLVLATHQINSVQETYFEEKKAFDAVTSTINAPFVGVVSREYTLGGVGQAAVRAGDQAQYSATATFDGCPTVSFRWIPDEKKLPNGIPSRYTQVVEGALVYDPRRDSTQPGGSGPHRANDQTTWAYATLDGNGVPIGRNNALQALWYLLGWRIPTKDAAGNVTGSMLVAGRGVDPQDINFASFIAGANACEAAGYYTDVVLSTGDTHTENEDKITCDGLIGRLIDPGGLWSYYANVDDTANIALELTDDDISSAVNFQWEEYKGMADQFNQVGGKFINPAVTTLFQPFPYPLVRDATYEANLGVKRRKPLDFEQVLDGTLAQRLARLFLNQGQFQGELSAGFLPRAIKAQAWSVVRYTSARWGWVKLFRVWRHDINTDGAVGMHLKEIHPSIWGAGTVTTVMPPSAGTPYDPLQQIAATGVTVGLQPMVGAGGTNADGFNISWTAPPINVRRTEVHYRLVGTANWINAGPVERDVTVLTIGPLLSGAIYEAQVRHISVDQIPGPWVWATAAPANAAGQFQLGTTGNVNYAAIQAAGGTATWANVTGPGRPTDYADVTGSNIAAGFSGQGPFATDTRSPNDVFRPPANLLKNPGLRLRFQNWIASTWQWQGGGNEGPYAVLSGVSGTGYVLRSDVIRVYAGIGYSYAAELYFQPVAGAGQALWMDIQWYSDTNGTVSLLDGAGVAVTTTLPWGKVRGYEVAPAGAQSAYIRVFGAGLVNGTVCAARRFQFYSGNAEVPFEDAASDSALWSNGNGIDSLRPAEFGSNITENRIASGFNGQSAWATEVTPISAILQPSGNMFPYPFSVQDGRAAADYGWGNDVATATFTRIWQGSNSGIPGYYQHYRQTAGAPAATLYPFYDVTVDGTAAGRYICISLNGYASGGTFSPYMEIWAGLPGASANLGTIMLAINPRTQRWEGVALAPAGTAVLRLVTRGIFAASSAYQDVVWYGIKLELNTTGACSAFNDDVGVRNAVSRVSPYNGRVLDPRYYNTQAIVGAQSTTNLNPSYTVGASNVTVNLPAHTRKIAGPSGAVTLSYGASSGTVAFNAYWTAYIDDPNLTGFASPSVVFTSNPDDLLAPNRYQIASGIAPSSSGTGGSTGTGGGGSKFDNCVAVESFMPSGVRAMQVKPGDLIEVLEEVTWCGYTTRPVRSNVLAEAECVELTSASGIKLVLSASTPCTLKGGATVLASDVLDHALAVRDADGFRWETIVDVQIVGIRAVAHISCDDGTYAAGQEPGRYIYTHNLTAKP